MIAIVRSIVAVIAMCRTERVKDGRRGKPPVRKHSAKEPFLH